MSLHAAIPSILNNSRQDDQLASATGLVGVSLAPPPSTQGCLLWWKLDEQDRLPGGVPHASIEGVGVTHFAGNRLRIRNSR